MKLIYYVTHTKVLDYTGDQNHICLKFIIHIGQWHPGRGRNIFFFARNPRHESHFHKKVCSIGLFFKIFRGLYSRIWKILKNWCVFNGKIPRNGYTCFRKCPRNGYLFFEELRLDTGMGFEVPHEHPQPIQIWVPTFFPSPFTERCLLLLMIFLL